MFDFAQLEEVRRRRPLIHCVSNIVTANDCANLALAVGASPMMAQAPEEMEAISSISGATVLNTGTPDAEKFRACRICAVSAHHPVVLDPVGVGASPWRLGQVRDLLDGFTLCSDYCFNVNPFYSRDMFAEFVQPYLKEILDYYRANGYYSIKHTDGNVMPILDMIVDCGPDAVHSLDPQGGVDLAEAKRLYGDRVCLIGNVNCGLMQTGTEEELVEDVRRALRQGMPGYGYIFSTSNCAYTGMPLERYEMMIDLWREYGNYDRYPNGKGF